MAMALAGRFSLGKRPPAWKIGAVVGLLAAIGVIAWLEVQPHDRVDSRLRNLIAHERGRVFALSEIAEVAWDRVYVLGPYSNTSAIRELAKLPRHVAEALASHEGACLLVFLGGDDITYYLLFKRRYGDFAQAARAVAYPRAHARFIVPVDQPRRWPEVRWAGAI